MRSLLLPRYLFRYILEILKDVFAIVYHYTNLTVPEDIPVCNLGSYICVKKTMGIESSLLSMFITITFKVCIR